MTKKKLTETKALLESLKDTRAAVEKMSDEECLAYFGLPRAKVLENANTAISRYEREIEKATSSATAQNI